MNSHPYIVCLPPLSEKLRLIRQGFSCQILFSIAFCILLTTDLQAKAWSESLTISDTLTAADRLITTDFVTATEPLPDQDQVLERFVQVGREQLALLEKQNLANEQKGEAWNNQYVLYIDYQQLLTSNWHNAAGSCPNLENVNQIVRLFDQRYNTSTKKAVRFYVLYVDKFEITFKKDVSITNYSSLLKAASAESEVKAERVRQMAARIVSGVEKIFGQSTELKTYSAWAAVSLGTLLYKNNVGKPLIRNFYYDQTGGTRLAPQSKGACYFHTDVGSVLHPTEQNPCVVIEESVREAISALEDVMAPTPSVAYVGYQCGGTQEQGRSQGGNGLVVNYARSVSEDAIRQALQQLSATQTQTGGVTARLFLTDAQTPASERTVIDNQVKSIQARDIIIWIDFNAQGQASPQFYFGSSYAPLTQWQKLVNEVFGTVNLNPGNINFLTALLDGLAWMVSNLKIPERFYDPDHTNPQTGQNDFNPTLADIYFYVSKANPGSYLSQGLISQIPKVGGFGRDQTYAVHRVELAFVCGFWNGLVDQVQGLPELASWVVKMITDEPNAEGIGTRKAFLASWDKFKTDCAGNPASATYGGCVWDMLWPKIRQAHTQGGPCKIAAQVGNDVANLATFFVAFAKAGKLANVSRLLETLDVTTYVFRGAGLLLRYTLPNLTFAYRLGKATIYLVVETVGTGATATFRIMAVQGQRLLYTLEKGLDDLLGMPGYAIIEQGDRLVLGIDGLPTGGGIEDIVDNTGKKIQDAYGNYLAQVKDAAGNYQLAIVKVRGGTGGLSALLARLKTKLENLGWTQADIGRFEYDLGTADDLLRRFDEGEFDFDASRALDGNKTLRRSASLLTALTYIRQNLPDGISFDQIKAAINKSDSKETFITDLELAIKNIGEEGQLDKVKKMVEKGVLYNASLPRPLNYTSIGQMSNNIISSFVDMRKKVGESVAKLTSTGDAYKKAREGLITQIGRHSEQIAEAVADQYFRNNGFDRVDDLLADALPGGNKPGKFDRVYHNKQTGEWKIVECKGGTSELGGRRRKSVTPNTHNEQGTKEYIQSVVEDLTRDGNSLSVKQEQLLRQLNNAIRDGKTKSYILRQPFDDITGELKDVRLATIF